MPKRYWSTAPPCAGLSTRGTCWGPIARSWTPSRPTCAPCWRGSVRRWERRPTRWAPTPPAATSRRSSGSASAVRKWVGKGLDMNGSRYVAVDLGAESGRVIVGTLAGERVALEEVHRFPNVPMRTPDGLHWDVLRLYAEVLAGLRAAVQRNGRDLAGIGVDSWAVDYGLLDAGGRLLG